MAETKSPGPNRVLRFGVFQVNLAGRELRKHGVRIRLPGQPFCILSTLLEKPGEVVTREEMRHRLWSSSDTFVDFEHSLNSAIKKLRTALGDSPENSRYIETIPRVGYRFIAPVEDIPANGQFPARVLLPTADSSVTTKAKKTWQRRWAASLAISVILIALMGGYFVWSRTRVRPQPQNKVTTETRTDAHIADARVKDHESSTSNNQPRLSSKLGEAHDLYIKGMYFWNKRTVSGFHQAIGYFQQATTADPNFTLAYAGLANSYTLLTAYSPASAALYMPQARAAALRALELDEGLAEAHTALALIVQNQDWDWQTSEKEYRRAIELNPNYATAHQWYAEHLMWRGRFDEALAESERARQLDPLSLIVAADHGAILYFSRRYDLAIGELRAVLRRDPNFGRAGALLTWAYVEKAAFPQALANAEIWHRLFGDGPEYWWSQAYIYGRAGQLEQARNELAKLEKVSRHDLVDPVIMLWAHLGVGDKEEALADLEKAYAEHFNIMTSLKVEPGFDPLRSDPRFQDLLRRVGLAQR